MNIINADIGKNMYAFLDKAISNMTTAHLRNGDIVKMIRRGEGFDETYTKVDVIYFSDKMYRTLDGRCPFMSDEFDIVEVDYSLKKKTKKCKNVIKVRIFRDDSGCWWFESIGLNVVSKYYSSKSSCVRGAKRFCKKIDFECKIVK